MKNQTLRCSRLTQNQVRKKKSKNSSNKLSQSPTLASSYSQKSLWARSYKNQPFPKELRKKIWGKKFEFDISSEEQQQITAVVEEQETEGVEKKAKKLPHFKIIADQGEFLSKRCRIKSEFQYRYKQRCKSVESLKYLEQVLEEKKQEDDLGKLQRSKLPYFKDKNQFNLKKNKSSDSHTEAASKIQSLKDLCPAPAPRDLPYQIEQNQAEQTKSVKLPGQKSIITAEIQKIIVDQLDSRKRKQDLNPHQIQQIPEEQKMQDQIDNLKLNKLRLSLEKFESESEYLNQIRDGQIVKKTGKQSARSQNSDGCSLGQHCSRTHIQRNQDILEGQSYEEIKECTSSQRQDDEDKQKVRNVRFLV